MLGDICKFLLVDNLVAFSIFLVTFWLVYGFWKMPKNLPPSPGLSLPIVGHLYLFPSKYYVKLQEWANSLGPVYTLNMGSNRCIVVSGYRMMKELLSKRGHEFENRPTDFFHGHVLKHRGILSSNGERWREQRRFALHTLRDFGMGKQIIERKIQEESDQLTTFIKESKGEKWDTADVFPCASANIICSIIWGQRYAYDDPVAVRRATKYLTDIGLRAFLALFIPSLVYLPMDVTGVKKLINELEVQAEFYSKLIDEHEKTLDENNPRDFMDAYIIERNRMKGKPGGEYFDSEQFFRVIDDFFLAGTQTTAVTLKWAIALMVLHKEVQDKVRAEILDVLGPDKMPSMKDKTLMPYTEATLSEIQRFGNILPVGEGNAVIKDTSVNGYDIPAGTWVILNLYGLNIDEAVYHQADKFKPERFLDKGGKATKPEEFIPFLIGSRNCVGESLAKVELFIFFTRMIQKFKFVAPKGEERTEIEVNFDNFFSVPQHTGVCAIELWDSAW